MQQAKEACLFCQEKFDRVRHAPRDIGCGSHHLVCTECLSNGIHSYEKRIICLLHGDKEKTVNLRNKVLADFPIIELAKTKTDQTFCTQHGNMNQMVASFICLECPANICSNCSQDHRKAGHNIVSMTQIASEKKRFEDNIKNKLQIIEETRSNQEKRYNQVEKAIMDEADKCLREFQSQIALFKNNISMHLTNANKACNTELNSIDNEFGYWKNTLLEKVKRLSKDNDPELALRNLYKEQKDLQYNPKINQYEEKITKQSDGFEKEMKKIPINFFQKFSEFIKKELSTELNLLKNSQPEEKRVGFNLENGYKPNNKDEVIDPRSSNRNQVNQTQGNQRERGRSQSKGPRDNRGRSSSKNKNKFEENKLSDPRPTAQIRSPSNSNGVDRSLGLDHLADSIRQSFKELGIPLTVENNGGLVVKMVNTMHKSSISSETASLIQQYFASRSEEELKSITQVDLICSGLDGSGLSDIGSIISSFKNLTSLSIKFAKSEDMNAKDLTSLEKAFPKLERLKSLRIGFARWRGMSEKPFQFLLESLKDSHNLKSLELDLSGCSRLRDEGVKDGIALLSSLRNLEKLNINLAESGVTYNCFAQLKGHFDCMRTLKQVKVDFEKGTSSKQNDVFYYAKGS